MLLLVFLYNFLQLAEFTLVSLTLQNMSFK